MRRKVMVAFIGQEAALLEEELGAVVLVRQIMHSPDPQQRAEIWSSHIPSGLLQANEAPLKSLSSIPQAGLRIRAAVGLLSKLVEPGAPDQPVTLRPDMIETVLRAQQPIAGSGQHNENAVQIGFDDLVLHPDTRDRLKHIVDAIKVHRKVLDQWGFGNIIHRGTGIVCLFDGEPGTGKTLSAEVMANETGLRLNRVDVSTIVDKYIGETQKNLAKIFSQADPRGELLLFDEADSLFSKRTDVSKSNDRYSNMEINVLLQLIERYDGIVVLTTNLAKQMDEAFERRIMFKVSYKLPDLKMRMKLWALHLPDSAPFAENVDIEGLAWNYELGGGAIKNAALAAAYLAAARDRPIQQEDLETSAYAEAIAAGKLVRSF